MDDTLLNEIISLLKTNALFSGISDFNLEKIANTIELRTYEAGKSIICEGDNSSIEEFYLIKSGHVEVIKELTDDGEKKDSSIVHLKNLSAGEIIGEMVLLANPKRTASVRATTKSELLVLSVKKLQEFSSIKTHYDSIKKELLLLQNTLEDTPVYTKLSLNLTEKLRDRLADTNLVAAKVLKDQLELEKMRSINGVFLIIVISFMAIYAFFMSALSLIGHSVQFTTIISLPIELLLCGGLLYVVIISRYPLSFFGISVNRWFPFVLESIALTIPVLGLIVVIKLLLIHLFSPEVSLFSGYDNVIKLKNSNMTVFVLSISAYLFTCFLQEFLTRGATQSLLQHFLVGKKRFLFSILVSNLIFGMGHLYISLNLALAVIVIGFFWGWLYLRQGSLIGVTVSHMIIGAWAFFVVGFDNWM